MIQLESRVTNASSGELEVTSVWRKVLFPPPVQVPAIDTDTIEIDGVGTLYWKEQYRGIATSSRQVYARSGDNSTLGPVNPDSPGATPAITTRKAGDTSVLYARPLVSGEYEVDVELDLNRLSYIWPYLTLTNSAIIPVVVAPFDRNTGANILEVVRIGSTTQVRATCDTDTKSIKIDDNDSAYAVHIDGSIYTFDVALTDPLGVAGIGSNESRTYTVFAYAVPKVNVTGGTPYDSRSITVSTGTAGSGPMWNSVSLSAPPTEGSNQCQLQMNVTATATSHTVVVEARERTNGGSWIDLGDISGSLSPVAPAPPTTSGTTHDYSATSNRADSGAYSYQLEMTVKLYNASSTLVDTRVVSTSYNFDAF
jgi:hypothetical protein